MALIEEFAKQMQEQNVPFQGMVIAIGEVYPILDLVPDKCPADNGYVPPEEEFETFDMRFWACSETGNSVSSLIVHLNDDHLWTREMIADWVDSFDTSSV